VEAGLAPQLIDVAHPAGVTSELAVGLDPALVDHLDAQAAWLADNDLIERRPSIDELVAHEPLAEARRLLAEPIRPGAAA
jgi:hypothetical protein